VSCALRRLNTPTAYRDSPLRRLGSAVQKWALCPAAAGAQSAGWRLPVPRVGC